MMEVRIATRGSKLALWQAEHVRDLLLSREPELRVTLLVLRTTGDQIQDRPLHEVGGKGLFTKEIEEALLDRRADVAVHSMKDLPAEGPEGLVLAAVPVREDPRDALLVRPGLRAQVAAAIGAPLTALPEEASVGTTSLRRICLLRRLRPSLRIHPLRGNVDSRLRRLDADELDVIVLAAAGLRRLGHEGRIDALLPIADSVPAVGQGALALQCRADDEATRARLGRLADPATTITVSAERAFLAALHGTCKTPLGAHATLSSERLHLDGFIGHPDGHPFLRAQIEGHSGSAEALGRVLAEQLLSAGGRQLLDALAT